MNMNDTQCWLHPVCVLPACSCPGAIEHASQASSTTWIHSGTVPASMYKQLLEAMHAIIQQQQALKQKEKAGKLEGKRRSHFQRTPAFIHSAVQAALAALAADQEAGGGSSGAFSAGDQATVPFPPPRGGFTDVGKHTGGNPKATSWPLLQSMIKVGHWQQRFG